MKDQGAIVLTTAPAPEAAAEPAVATAPTPAPATAVVALTTAHPDSGATERTRRTEKMNFIVCSG